MLPVVRYAWKAARIVGLGGLTATLRKRTGFGRTDRLKDRLVGQDEKKGSGRESRGEGAGRRPRAFYLLGGEAVVR